MPLDPNEFNQFLTNAKIKLVGASDNGVKAELYDVMKEFFTDSNAWREDITLNISSNVQTYVLSPADDGQIIRLFGVWDTNFIPVPAFMPNFGVLQLVNPPQSGTTYTVRVSKTVTQPITSDNLPIAPDWTLRVYSVPIMDGLLGKMMSQQNKSYSNQNMARYHLARFIEAIKIARTEANTANTVGAQNWSYPGFAKGSQRGGVSTAYPTRVW